MSKFTDEEVGEVFELSRQIEKLLDSNDFNVALNALLLAVAKGLNGRGSKDQHMEVVNSNLSNWMEILDEMSADHLAEEKALIEQFKQTDWYYQYGEGNGYLQGKESYEKTMRMVTEMGERGLELMEKYIAEHGIKS
jgi:hypothetical protein